MNTLIGTRTALPITATISFVFFLSNLVSWVLSNMSRVSSRGCPEPRNACIFPPHQTTSWGSLLNRRALPRVAVVINLVLLLAGCFNYVPTDFTTVPVGEDIRLIVSRERVPDLGELTLQDDPAPVLEGTLERREDTSLIVRIPVGRRTDGLHSVALGQAIHVHPDAIISAELRVLDGFKTTGIITGMIAGATTLLLLGMDAMSDQAPLPQPDPPDFRMRLISIPIG